jgi:hypothetical protein
MHGNALAGLSCSADIITQHPVALQLRMLQTMAEISGEKNSTIIFPAQHRLKAACVFPVRRLTEV